MMAFAVTRRLHVLQLKEVLQLIGKAYYYYYYYYYYLFLLLLLLLLLYFIAWSVLGSFPVCRRFRCCTQWRIQGEDGGMHPPTGI